MLGPSAVTIGEGVIYVGDRASAEVCAVDAKTLQKKSCLTVPVPTDGISYVAATKEVWVTTPKDGSLTVLDASKPDALAAKLSIKTDGEVVTAVASHEFVNAASHSSLDWARSYHGAVTPKGDAVACRSLNSWRPDAESDTHDPNPETSPHQPSLP